MKKGDDSTARFRSRLEQGSRPGGYAIATSVLVHLLAIGSVAFGRFGRDSEFDDFQTYRVKIYSPPPQVEGPAQLVPVSQPTPAVADPKPQVVEAKPEPPRPTPPAPKPEPKPAPKPEPPKPKPAEAPKPTPARSEPARPAANTPAQPVVGPNAKPGSPGGENIDVDIPGAEFPFPDYLENVILQINRYFRWAGASNLRVRVGFFIRDDGSVLTPRVLEGSGNREFDRAALRALDEISKRKAFGPLPDAFTPDRLGISYTFDPPKR